MSRRTTVYASAYSPSEPKYAQIEQGESIRYSVDWNGVLNSFATPATISSSTWTQDQSSNITLSSETNTGGVVTAMFTGINTGRTVITNSVTFSNAEVREQKFASEVLNSRQY